MFDTHTHTHYSHDATADPALSCETAFFRGLSGIAFTDHADIEYADTHDVIGKCRETYLSLERIKKQYGGRILVANGIELGEWLWNRSAVERILTESAYDAVLASVHAVRYEDFTQPYSGIDFRTMSEKQLNRFIFQYFEDYYETADTCDADIITHLTCPWRYIVGKYGIDLGISDFMPQIRRILRKIIEKDLAFEVNTSCLGGSYDRLMPDTDILGLYKDLGGDKITIGSDAHVSARIGCGFDVAAAALKSIGIHRAYYFINRTPIEYNI